MNLFNVQLFLPQLLLINDYSAHLLFIKAASKRFLASKEAKPPSSQMATEGDRKVEPPNTSIRAWFFHLQITWYNEDIFVILKNHYSILFL